MEIKCKYIEKAYNNKNPFKIEKVEIILLNIYKQNLFEKFNTRQKGKINKVNRVTYLK